MSYLNKHLNDIDIQSLGWIRDMMSVTTYTDKQKNFILQSITPIGTPINEQIWVIKVSDGCYKKYITGDMYKGNIKSVDDLQIIMNLLDINLKND